MEYFILISLLMAMVAFLILHLRQSRVLVKIKSEKPKRYICVGLLFAALLCCGSVPNAYAADIWVNTLIDENDTLCNDGDCSLRDAIWVTNPGDTIRFGVNGTIVLSLGQLTITKNLTINGSDVPNLVVSGNNAYRVFEIIGVTTTVSMSDMTISNGKAPDGSDGTPGTPGECGGGIRNEGDLTLERCSISNNTSGNGGNGNPSGNGANGGAGGGICNFGASPVLDMTECIVENNITGTGGNGSGAGSTGGPGGLGGGIYNGLGGTLTMTYCTIRGNHTGNGGNGVSNGGEGGVGGGIYAENASSSDLAYCTIEENYTGNGTSGGDGGAGGGLYLVGSATIAGCTINENYTGTGANGGSGGGIYSVGVSTVLTNCTVSDNYTGTGGSGGGGGINVFAGTLNLKHCTITENRAMSSGWLGGGIMNSGGTVTVTHTIISANNADTNPEANGSFTTNGYNLISNNTGTVGFAIIPTNLPNSNNDYVGDGTGPSSDPALNLGALADNGGRTRTHALLAGSIHAIDNGDPAIATPPPNDQRGIPFSRIAGPGPSSIIDIGAFEVSDAEIQVEDAGGSVIPVGGTFNFGSATLGTPVIKTFTVRNMGATDDLDLADLSVDPPEFSNTPFVTLPISPGFSTTFDVHFLAASLGPHSSKVSFRANDSDEYEYYFFVTGTVNPANTPPTTSGIPAVTVNEDADPSVINLTNHFNDAQSGATGLAYTIQGNTSPGLVEASITVTTLTLPYSPNRSGTANLKIRATDPGGLFVETSFDVTVNPVNDPPQFTAANPAPVDEDADPQTISGWVTSFIPGPPDEASQTPATYIVKNISNPALFANPPAVNSDGTLRYVPAKDAFGTSAFDVAIQDSGGTANGGIDTSLFQTYTITVNPVNDPPVIRGQQPIKIAEDSKLPLEASHLIIADPDSSEFTLTVKDGENYALSGNTLIPKENFNGELKVPVTVSDGIAESEIFELVVTVSEVNDIPMITGQNPLSAPEEKAVSIKLTDLKISDPDNTFPEDFRLMILDGAHYTLSANANEITPEKDFNGDLTVPVKVSDGRNESDKFDLKVTVTPVNDAPDFTAADPPETDEDAGEQTVAGWISAFIPGPENESDQTAAYLISDISNPDLFAVPPGVDPLGNLTYTSAKNAFGVSKFKVTVQDSGGTKDGGEDKSKPQIFTVKIRPVNDAPFFTSEPLINATEDASYRYNVQAEDAERDRLKITASELPEWLHLTDNRDGTATLEGTPGDPEVGEHLISLEVSDGELTGIQSFSIRAENINDAPILDNSGVMYLNSIDEDTPEKNNSGTRVADIIASSLLDDPITDADKDALEGIAVIAADSPNGKWQYNPYGEAIGYFLDFPKDASEENAVLLNPDAVIRFIPNRDDNGTAEIVFRAWDQTQGKNGDKNADTTENGGTSAFSTEFESAFISINPVNDPPVFDGEMLTTATEDEEYHFSCVTSDIDLDDTRMLTAPTLPDWLSFSDNGDSTGTLAGTPDNSHVGSHPVVLEVKDAAGAISTKNFTITVENVNDAPEFTTSQLPEASEDTDYVYTVTTSDIDSGDTRKINALTLPDWLSFSDNGDGTGTLAGTPANGDIGEHQIVLQVTDAAGASEAQEFPMIVENTNDPPEFTSSPLTVIDEDEIYTYPITTADIDVGDSRKITALLLPEWVMLKDNGDGTAILEGMPKNKHVGEHSAELRVEDAAGASDTQSFIIDVMNSNDAPIFTSIPLITALEDTLYAYQITTKDPDKNDKRKIIAPILPDWLTFTDNGDGTAILTGTPANEHVGTSHEVKLKVKDADSAKDVQVFTIQVENVNDAPLDMFLTNNSVKENKPVGTLIGNFSVSDPDMGDSHAYTLISGSGDADNTFFTIDGNALNTAAVFDYDTQNTYHIRVRVADTEGGTYEKPFTVEIKDLPALTIEKTGAGWGTVSSEPGGISCGDDCAEIYDTGAMVRLSASPGWDSVFAGWMGADCKGISPCTVEMNADMKIIAVFYALCYPEITVTTTRDDGEGSLRQAIADVCDGGTITLNVSDPIRLTGGELFISKDLTITTSGDFTATILRESADDFRIFNIHGGANVILENLVIQNGTADNGGGIYNAGNLNLRNITISANSAETDGGAVYNAGALNLNNSTLFENSADKGGGIYNAGTLAVSNSTVSGNISDAGGGVYNTGDLAVSASTFFGNQGGIYNEAGRTAEIGSTIIAGNGADVKGPFISTGYNLIGDDSGSEGFGESSDLTGSDENPIDPLLEPLADNGGLTPTHALKPGSPAMDAGNPVANPSDYDQRGFSRVMRGIADMGAYEYQRLANFYTLTVQKSGIGSGTVTSELPGIECGNDCTENYEDGSSVKLSARADDGSFFEGWQRNGESLNCNAADSGDTCEIIIDGDTLITVEFCLPEVVVSRTGDSGTGTLRWAIDGVCDEGKIMIDTDAVKQPIELTSGSLFVRKSMSITTTDGSNVTVRRKKNTARQSSADEDIPEFSIFDISEDVKVSMENLTITNGSGNNIGSAYNIGGIFNRGKLALASCWISGNSAYRDVKVIGIQYEVLAGGIFNVGKLTLYKCTISDNSAYRGNAENEFETGAVIGGIYNAGTLTMINTTVSGNSADSLEPDDTVVGGIYTADILKSSFGTITDNFAHGGKISIGGIYNTNETGAEVKNTLIAENTSDAYPDVRGIFTGNYNLIGIGSGSMGFEAEAGNQIGTAAIPIDPMLESLADNGGGVPTLETEEGSPAIDAGDPDTIPVQFDMSLENDARGTGFPRVHDGDGDGTARADIGAYELSFGFISLPSTAVSEEIEYLYEIKTTAVNNAASRGITATSALPEWLTLTDNKDGTAILSGIPTTGDAGDYRIELHVQDNYGLADFQFFTIRVLNVNYSPAFTSTPGTEAIQHETYAYNIISADPDPGDSLIITGKNLPAWLHLTDYGDGTAILSGTPSSEDAGNQEVVLEVRDAAGITAIQSFMIDITGASDSLMIAGQKPLSVPAGESLTIDLDDLIINDPDNTYPDGFTLRIQDGANYTREADTIWTAADFSGTLTVPVSVSNGTAESDIFPLSVDVTDILPDDMRTISGTVSNLDAEKEIEINAVSLSTGFSQIISMKGTGEPLAYTVTELEAAPDYRVEISSADYHYQVYRGKDRWEDADPIDLSYHNADGIDFILTPAMNEISGTVIFPEDASLGDQVRVKVAAASTFRETEILAEFQGDWKVPYVISGLFQDSYIISVWSERYLNRYYDGTETGAKAQETAVPVSTDSLAADAVNFRLERGRTISGTVFGTDAGGLYVEAWEYDGSSKGTVTGETGDYLIQGLEPGPAQIVVWKKDTAPFFHHDGESARETFSAVFVNTENGDLSNVDITLTQGQSISGTVRNETGDPLSWVWVDARSDSQQAGHGVYTGEEGMYEITGLPEGSDYRVAAHPHWSEPYLPAEKTDVFMGSTGADFTLKLREAYKIEGSVTDENGNHVPNIEVEIRSDAQDFYGWDMGKVGELHIPTDYEIRGLPPGDDYLITVRPPDDSPYAVYTEEGLSIHNDEILDIVLKPGIKISGTIAAKEGGLLAQAWVFAFSAERNFHGKAVSDVNGFYGISNAPDASDYVITAIADGYAVQERVGKAPGDGIDFTLEPGGFLMGEIKDEAGNPLSGVTVEVYSASLNFGGAVQTDENGRYAVTDLAQADTAGDLVDDYVVVAYPEYAPPMSETEEAIGSEINFVTVWEEMGLSGTVTDFDGNLPEFQTALDIFEKNGDFIKSVPVETDGIFYVSGLSPEEIYQLRFIAFTDEGEWIQWAGEGDIGFDDPDPYGDENPADAKAYYAGETINFRFGKNSERLRTAKDRNQDSPVLKYEEGEIRNLRSTPPEIVSQNPNITVTWESASGNSDEKYYYLFNSESEYRITKRNAPAMRPVRARKVMSGNLTGDDVPYYFHVAAVDKRGRIGETANTSFRIDTVPPSSASATTAAKTVSESVILTLGATGATEMYISNSDYGKLGKWEKWDRTREWKLTKGEGSKRIYVKFRDRAGNTANALAQTEKVDSLPDQYQITAVAGDNGTISPSGEIIVYSGEGVTFTLTPNAGYEIDKLFVDGSPVSLTDGRSYTLQNIVNDMSVAATFKMKAVITHSITATAGDNGSITPEGEITVEDGKDISFRITPDPGYMADAVMLDGRKVRLREDSTFQFINVDRDYTLSVSFSELP